MELKIVAEQKKARIEITGEIGWVNDAESFRWQVRDLVRQGITHAHLYLHTPGGDVFHAEEMINILGQFSTVTGEGGALVASAGTKLAMFCKSFSMPANGLMMIHRPHITTKGTVAEIESELEAMRQLDANYLAAYKAKATDPEGFEERWHSNTDIWYGAEAARAAGFVDKVTQQTEITKEARAQIAACGYKGQIGVPAPDKTEDGDLNVSLNWFFKK